MKIIVALFFGTLLTLSFGVSAQTTEPSNIPKDKNMVSIPVTVSDREGRYIAGLKKDDFSIYEDGVKQNVAFFATVDEPLSIVLLLDTSGSTASSLEKIKDAAKDFVELLNPKDQGLIATFDSQLKVLNSFSSSTKTLKEAIDKVQTAQQDGTVLNYAIQQTIQKSFVNTEGRKVVIILSDGKDFGSPVTKSELLGILEESDVLIYSIHYKTGTGIENLVISSDGKVKEVENKKPKKEPKPKKQKGYSITIPGQIDVISQEEIDHREKQTSIEAVDFLKQLSDTTAGRFYLSDAPNLSNIFKQIAGELREQYWLGYRSKDSAAHEINVKVGKPDVVVRSRAKVRSK
ncbi:MAG TPA: VWA domain-containing protein [Pyrinomonadaceae bacterium]|nr:VWA domain-containing protein [Pyrinomonadaceae bacterium]